MPISVHLGVLFSVSFLLAGEGLIPGVHTAKAEECTTPYMCQDIKINIGVGGLHATKFAKNSPAKNKLGIECASTIPVTYCHS